ncbi:MAG: nucleotidyl transferase [Chthoniobacter sp.]
MAGEPFLAHQLRLLHARGLRRAILCVGYLGEMIERDFGDGSAFGMELRYSFDGPKLLGTGGALRQALPLLGEEFFVLYGDSYLPIDYAAVLGGVSRQRAAGIDDRLSQRWGVGHEQCALRRGGASCVTTNARARRRCGTSTTGSASFARRSLRSGRRGRAFDLADVQRELVAKDALAGHEVFQRFYEIGSHAGLAELETLLRPGTPL